LAQGEVFEGELAVAADADGQEPKQVEQESDYRAEMWPDRSRQINHLAAGQVRGEGQPSKRDPSAGEAVVRLAHGFRQVPGTRRDQHRVRG
jgi:hypothetical protein